MSATSSGTAARGAPVEHAISCITTRLRNGSTAFISDSHARRLRRKRSSEPCVRFFNGFSARQRTKQAKRKRVRAQGLWPALPHRHAALAWASLIPRTETDRCAAGGQPQTTDRRRSSVSVAVYKLQNLLAYAPRSAHEPIREDVRRITQAAPRPRTRTSGSSNGGGRCPAVAISLEEGGHELLTLPQVPEGAVEVAEDGRTSSNV